VIVTDNRPEFTSQALGGWAYERKVRLTFICRGQPAENAFIESFSGRLRDLCLNEHWFLDVKDARENQA
jgi:putative transposase